MITKGVQEAIGHELEEIFIAGEVGEKEVLTARKQEIYKLIRMEAVNLADQIIGKDRIIHSDHDSHGNEFLDPADKAVFDFQVSQRVKLAEYQNPKGKPTGPEEMVNNELAENEQ